jgi:hypothetical protein
MINYIIKGFGYDSIADYKRSMYGLFFNGKQIEVKLLLLSFPGLIRMFVKDAIGFDLPVLFAFVFLIVAEFQTGVKVAKLKRGERFRSRPVGRMIIKIGTYIAILWCLNTFSKGIDAPDIMGVGLNPLTWLYYVALFFIIFQLLISWFENLGSLGYKEAGGLVGYLLRKFNKWFEFDGTKDNSHDNNS